MISKMLALTSAFSSSSSTAAKVLASTAAYPPALHTSGANCFFKQFLKAPYKPTFHSIKAMAETHPTPVRGSQSSTSGQRRALISVYDEENLSFLGNALQELGYTIVSTRKTASALEAAGVSVTKVEELTHVPEMLDGLIETLHATIHGGILTGTFEVVVVNVHTFYEEVVSYEDGIDSIDVGGLALITSAVANHKNVLVVVDPEDYPAVLGFIRAKCDDQQFRRMLAVKALKYITSYDSGVAEWFGFWVQTDTDEGTSPATHEKANDTTSAPGKSR